MKRRYKVWVKEGGHMEYMEVWSHCGAFGAWVKVLWWRLIHDPHYRMWRHWPKI